MRRGVRVSRGGKTHQTTSFGVLRTYLQARGSFTAAEFDFIETMFVPARLAAHQFLQRAGAVPKQSAFVAKGCLRKYVIDAQGKEHIVQFAPETWWVADAPSLANGSPSQYFIDALEDSDVLLIDAPSHEAIVQKVPGYADAFRRGLQKHAAARDERIVSNLSASAQERYMAFLQTYPSIARRVPQRMLASYLGVSPETVSRIRRKLAGR
jgi:CRP-like cAMP-binding protein